MPGEVLEPEGEPDVEEMGRTEPPELLVLEAPPPAGGDVCVEPGFEFEPSEAPEVADRDCEEGCPPAELVPDVGGTGGVRLPPELVLDPDWLGVELDSDDTVLSPLLVATGLLRVVVPVLPALVLVPPALLVEVEGLVGDENGGGIDELIALLHSTSTWFCPILASSAEQLFSKHESTPD